MAFWATPGTPPCELGTPIPCQWIVISSGRRFVKRIRTRSPLATRMVGPGTMPLYAQATSFCWRHQTGRASSVYFSAPSRRTPSSGTPPRSPGASVIPVVTPVPYAPCPRSSCRSCRGRRRASPRRRSADRRRTLPIATAARVAAATAISSAAAARAGRTSSFVRASFTVGPRRGEAAARGRRRAPGVGARSIGLGFEEPVKTSCASRERRSCPRGQDRRRTRRRPRWASVHLRSASSGQSRRPVGAAGLACRSDRKDRP